ncbi:MAG: bifunctional phosphoribosylaminoimidazolecarboxamide formyltransferase/IMP cyclohydrolase [Candidatus Omnitrophota bacterium]
MRVKRALISVSNKDGLDLLVKTLEESGVEIISTGGTAELIRSMGVKVRDVSEYTGFGEMLDGRVKTLHPFIHAGILADRDNDLHMRDMKKKGIPLIDMVVVDLYPFEKTVSRPGVSFEDAIENIDIGGPTMLRAAAKNFKHVAAVSSPERYAEIISELNASSGEISESTLFALAKQVFELTGGYDSKIASYLSTVRSAEGSNKDKPSSEPLSEQALPGKVNIDLEKSLDLRYGENPHQRGAFYTQRSTSSGWMGKDMLLQGKELSFNNILDLSAALDIVSGFKEPAAAVIKHNNPSGAAWSDGVEKAFLDALNCDRMSAFGGIIGLNRPVDGRLAGTILSEAGFFECLIAPGYDKKALEIFSEKKNLRVVKYFPDALSPGDGLDIKKIRGGFLVQDADSDDAGCPDLREVTRRKISSEEKNSLLFAWKIARFVKSNAIVLAAGTRTVGIGAGQMSRVDSVDVAIAKAGKLAKGAVLASDAFFPKPDSIHKAHAAGISAIIQPGGSIRDKEVIEASDEAGIAMVFTSKRHFRH